MLYLAQKSIQTNSAWVNSSVGFFFFYTSSHFLLQQTLSTSLGGTWSAAVCWSLAMVGVGLWLRVKMLLSGWKLSPQKHLFKIKLDKEIRELQHQAF